MIELNATRSHFVWAAIAALAMTVVGCKRSPYQTTNPSDTIHLADLVQAESIKNHIKVPPAGPPRHLWRFDGSSSHPPPAEFPATLGWDAWRGVTELIVRDGRLVGKSANEFPLIRFQRTVDLDDSDILHHVEIRLKASAGSILWLAFKSAPPMQVLATPLLAGEEFSTYTLRPESVQHLSELKYLVLRPTDVPNAVFEIESVRLIGQKEHQALTRIPTGQNWLGLSEIYKESIVARAPEAIELTVTLPSRPWLDLAVGIIDHGPVTFHVQVTSNHVGAPGSPAPSALLRTVTKPQAWEPLAIDLSPFAGHSVTLTLALEADQPGQIGVWGAPIIRSNMNEPATHERPQGVILIWADTLRRDHLDVYGYNRPTAPFLSKLASEGALFNDCLVQATWTKVSTPSVLTGLYPTTHGVIDFYDALPASATTLAEIFRDAGYATISYSSFPFTGKFTNLQQGFEEVHESESLPDDTLSKTSQEFVGRLLPWIERHQNVPFFVFLHVADPHDPFEPRPPYDRIWADPSRKALHQQQTEAVKEVMTDHVLKSFGMPTRHNLLQAGIDPGPYINQVRDWYDGSIRGMDHQIERLLTGLSRLGLTERTLVVFTSDHGEEFLDHGRMFHGQGVYAELSRVPLILHQPGTIPAGRVIDETVQNIDIMPTILQLCDLPIPDGLQGRSMVPLLSDETGQPRWTPRAAITEKASIPQGSLGPPPRETESYSIVLDDWKLIHNLRRSSPTPEFELYQRRTDSLDATNVAADYPAVVQRLAQQLSDWRRAAQAVKLATDHQLKGSLSAEEIERLRALGYIQ